MNVLFIAPVFFDYHKAIKKELDNRYKKVYFRNEIPLSVPLFNFIKRYFYFIFKIISELHNKRLIRFFKKKNIDCIFIIRGSIISTSFLDAVKNAERKIELFYYQWDSMKNNPNALLISNFTNHNFSFDLEDCSVYEQFRYLPLFYRWENNDKTATNIAKDIDVLFVGSYHKKRYELLEKIEETFQYHGFIFHKHLYLGFWPYLRHRKKDSIKVRGRV